MRNPFRKPPERPRSFAVWSHINGANQGDDLVVHTVIEALRARVPGCRVVAVCMYPPDAESRHGVPALRIGSLPSAPRGGRWARRARNLWYELPASWAAHRALRPIDRLIVAGSGPLEDDPGAAYRALKWSLLARLARTRVAFASVGAGPLDRRLNRAFVRRALSLADYITVRDQSTQALLRGCGVSRQIEVLPDMAFGFPRAELQVSPALPPTEVPTVGLNVMSMNDPRQARGIVLGAGDVERFNGYLAEMVEVAARVIRAGNRVVLFSSEFHHDLDTRREFVELFDATWPGLRDCGSLAFGIDDSPAGLLPTIASCDYVIATRFHSIVFPLLLGIPVVGLAYHPKTRDLLASFGLGDFAFDVASFEAAAVEEALRALQCGRAAVVEKIAAGTERRRAEVEAQFDTLAGAGPAPD